MSTNLVIERQNSNNKQAGQPDYSEFGPFASRTKGISTCEDAFGEILSFLKAEDLIKASSVCHDWRKCIDSTEQWKRQCQNMLGLSNETDPKRYLPEGPSYKKIFELVSPRILDANVYRRYVGEVGRILPIPEAFSFEIDENPDPCDLTKTVGAEYVRMFVPSYIETNLEGFSLDKPDDLNDPEAPRLIRKEMGLVEKFARKIGLGTKPENKVLKIPVTINNIEELFKRPKIGNPSKYDYVWNKIIEQHGNKRIPAGWICMRRNVIGRNLSFAQQQALANEKGVIISQLGHRILFNFLESVRSGTYPDGRGDPLTIARTSTPTRDSQGNDWPSGCGAGGPSGLRVGDGFIGIVVFGVSVALPAEVQAIGP